MNLFLYLLTVLIWGTTWIALKLQLGVVPIAWSVAYRFALAAVVLFVWLIATGRLKRPRGVAMGLVAAQGLFLFCLNFLCFMQASRYIPSGLVAVLFSTATVWNAFNARVFLGRPLNHRVLLGSLLGLLGLVALFWPELTRHEASAHTGLGMAYGLAGTLCFSIGNMLSTRLQATGHTPVVTNAWGMLMGATALTVGCLAAGVPWAFEANERYVGALLYLAIPGSVIGFTAYLTLVGRLGPEKAAYCTVLFPVVALNISAWVEGYAWTAPALLGLALVMAGNVLVFKKPSTGTQR
jgi:drug/metabolite transporter (DMT)-like permease